MSNLSMYQFSHNACQWMELEHAYPQDFSLVCSYFFHSYFHQLHYLATPIFEGHTSEGYCHSLIIKRKSSPRLTAMAYNYKHSLSGYLVIKNWNLKNQIQPKQELSTGSHLESVKALIDGRADYAAIDILSWNFIVHELDTSPLELTDKTISWPAPPLVSAEKLNFSLSKLESSMKTLSQFKQLKILDSDIYKETLKDLDPKIVQELVRPKSWPKEVFEQLE